MQARTNTLGSRFTACAIAALMCASVGCGEIDEIGSSEQEASRGGFGGFWGVIFQNGLRFEGTARVTPGLLFPNNLDLSDRVVDGEVSFTISESMMFLAPTHVSLDAALTNQAVIDLIVYNRWYQAAVEWLVYVSAPDGFELSRALTASNGSQATVEAKGKLGIAPGYTMGSPLTESLLYRVTPFVYTKFNPVGTVCVMVAGSFLAGQDLSHHSSTWAGVVAGKADGTAEITHYLPWSETHGDDNGDVASDTTDTTYYQVTSRGKGANGVLSSFDCADGRDAGDSNGQCHDFDADAGHYDRVELHGAMHVGDLASIRINDDGMACLDSCTINTDCELGEACIDGMCL